MFWERRVYLDQAAGVSGNSSSPHEAGRKSREILEAARTSIARLLEVQADDVIFTGGATEANALAILGLAKGGDHVLYLPSAHASIVENVKLLKERGVKVEPLTIVNGKVDIADLKRQIKTKTVLVTMEAVCGETGVIWNTREVASTLRSGAAKKSSAQAARPIQHDFSAAPLLHVDASQAPWTEKLTRAHFAANLLTFDASKVGEARGIGALIAHRTIPLTSLYCGGGQERGLRSGSEAPELAKQFASALGAAAKGREVFRASAERMRTQLVDTITKDIPRILINEGRDQVPHILNISLPGRDTDYLVALLDEEGFMVSTRSACETDSEVGSRAVKALFGDTERALSTLRISWGPDVSAHDLDRFAAALRRAVAFVDSEGKR